MYEIIKVSRIRIAEETRDVVKHFVPLIRIGVRRPLM